jgi:Ca-activated chloride channel family protein
MKITAFLTVALLAVVVQFSSRVNTVEVYVTVTDRDGRPVQGLSRADFMLFEDDVPQAVSVFAAGEMGLSVAVALDRSFSMAGERLTRMKQAAERFLRALRSGDQSMLIGIGSTVDVLAPLSADRARQIDTLAGLDAWGSTSLHDAVIQALDRIQEAPGRRALVLMSDGIDRYSQASASDVLDRARRGDVLAYPIALGKTRPPLFAELASITGGRSLQVSDPTKLAASLTSIAEELRQQYLLGYEPPARAAGAAAQWHRLRVEVKRKDVTIRARPGYWTH